MANFTATTAVRNSSAAVSFLGMQAAETIEAERHDDKNIIIINNSANDQTGMTATITVNKGAYFQNMFGTATISIAPGAIHAIGPLDSARFKTTAGTIVLGVAVAASGTVSSVTMAVINNP